jgi:hypothetical protein
MKNTFLLKYFILIKGISTVWTQSGHVIYDVVFSRHSSTDSSVAFQPSTHGPLTISRTYNSFSKPVLSSNCQLPISNQQSCRVIDIFPHLFLDRRRNSFSRRGPTGEPTINMSKKIEQDLPKNTQNTKCRTHQRRIDNDDGNNDVHYGVGGRGFEWCSSCSLFIPLYRSVDAERKE